jgi:hypothetical protein
MVRTWHDIDANAVFTGENGAARENRTLDLSLTKGEFVGCKPLIVLLLFVIVFRVP